MESLSQKRCTKCGEIKSIDEFSKHGKYRRACCRKCGVASTNEWRSNNPSFKEKAKKRYQTSKEKVKLTQKLYYQDNIESFAARARDWYLRNTIKAKARASDWINKNPEKMVEYRNIRRARIKKVGGVISANEWKDLKNKYNHTCLCCKKREPEIKLTLDHVKPLKLGGSNTIENAQPLCISCNSSKGAKWIDYRGGRK